MSLTPAAGRRPARRSWTAAALALLLFACGLLGATAAEPPPEVLVSASADRSDPRPLDGATLGSGAAYVFVAERADIEKVSFWLDDPARKKKARKVEGNAPWDFLGSARDDSALPWDPGSVSAGTHTVTVAAELSDGTTALVHATFTTGAVTPALTAAPALLQLTTEADGPPLTRTVDITSAPGTADVAATADAPWLAVSPARGSTPRTLDLTADPAGLPPGTHAATVQLQADGFAPASVRVELSVRAAPGEHDLWLSPHADRSAAVPLAGATVSGPARIFTAPDDGVSAVSFWLDDPGRTRAPYRVERTAPFDLAGGSVAQATALDTTDLADGEHAVTAVLTLAEGGTAVVDSTFTVANAPGPALVLAPATLSAQVAVGAAAVTRTVAVSSGSTPVPVTVSANAPWVRVTAGGTTPTTATVTLDPAGLSPGTRTAVVTVTSPGLPPASLPVTLTVTDDAPPPPPPPPPTHTIAMSAAPDRTDPVPLDGAEVRGDVHVFVTPETGLSKVEFFVDDPQLRRKPYKSEGNAPWDLAGSATDGSALPYDTWGLADGAHTVTARLTSTSGARSTVTAAFTVLNGDPVLTAHPRQIAVELAPGETARSDLTVRMSDRSAVPLTASADVPWLTVSPVTATTPGELAVVVDTAGLATGTHAGAVTIRAPGQDAVVVPVELRLEWPPPDQVHLSWTADPATTLTVTWRTTSPGTPWVEYAPAGATGPWTRAEASPRDSGTSGQLWTTTLTGLAPGQPYEYRVVQPETSSPTWTARTVAPGAETSAVYFADTGIDGRRDNLTVATGRTMNLLRDLHPDVLLAGGDYAYFNTDERFPTLDDAIDAWFDQLEPAAAQSPLMPTYGNHEVLLGEGYEPWAARFPTPEGWNERRSYSFDVGPFHFISLQAVHNTNALPSAEVAWLEADILAAKAAGREWIVPFTHVSAFAAGSVHPSNPRMRDQLGRVFERHGIRLVLQSHDQAYQRTWPLTGVGSTGGITATTTDLTCAAPGDGVVWMTVSPAGKLSNRSLSFSPYAETPAPFWSAVRDNTRHHVAELTASAGSDLEVEVLGYHAEGEVEVVDTVTIARESCG
ncbi:metallophosphoesterase family protein [Georgenia phoenicis]|uniref:purple acid phosphatase family protein n=1 Tax=unclassified Georgenia TaxID=2626815 RepID=UPI0039B0F998